MDRLPAGPYRRGGLRQCCRYLFCPGIPRDFSWLFAGLLGALAPRVGCITDPSDHAAGDDYRHILLWRTYRIDDGDVSDGEGISAAELANDSRTAAGRGRD